MKVTVFGSGSFGTALAAVVARNGHDVVMLTRRDEVALGINAHRRNPTHLSACELPVNVRATTNAVEAIAGAGAIVHAIPMQNTEAFLREVGDLVRESGALYVNTAKGLREETLELMHDVLRRILGEGHPCAFFGGPTFAEELARGGASGGVMAAATLELAERAAALFAGPNMRVYPSTDVVGVEIGGALKNVIAILAGGLEGMGMGMNALALLVTRGCREMTKLGVAMGAQEHTLAGLAGIGDLMLTCLGDASRNKAVGIAFGRGAKVTDILSERAQTLKGVAEGVATAPAAERLAQKLGIDAPMITTCAQCLRGELDAKGALVRCMTLPITPDEPVVEVVKRKVKKAAKSVTAASPKEKAHPIQPVEVASPKAEVQITTPPEMAASKEKVLEIVKPLEVAVQTEEAASTKPVLAVESSSVATPKKKTSGMMKTAMTFVVGVAVGVLIGPADPRGKKESKGATGHKLSITYS